MSPRRGALLALALLATGCAGQRPAARRDALPPPAPGDRAGTLSRGAGPATGSRRVQARRLPAADAARLAVATAAGLLGSEDVVVSGVDYGDGCAALVRAALGSAGVSLPDGDARALHEDLRARGATRRGRAAPGDLVFLADRPSGQVEHVGLVERVAADGTVVLFHRTDRGVARLRLNATQPWKARTDAGKALNDVLIVGAGRVTVARLLVAYATVR